MSPVVFLLSLLLKYLQNGNGLVSALCLTLKCSQLNRGHSEVMLCNFAVGLDLVTSLKIHKPLRRRPSWPGAPIPKLVSQSVRVLEAGSWSNRFPGDQRIKLDYSRLISFYDTALFPNLHLQRVGQERWDHRLRGINSAELDGLLLRSEEAFTEQESESDIDWKSLLHAVSL